MKRRLSLLEEITRLIVPIVAVFFVLLSHWKLEGIAMILIVMDANLGTLVDRYLDN